MKKYKRTRIIANLAVMGSLAWSSTTFAASTTPVTWGNRVKDQTNISVSRPMRSGAYASSTSEYRKKKDRGQAIRLKQGVLQSKYGGEILSLTTNGFVVQKNFYNINASSTAPRQYTIITSSSTVYMKAGKLDNATDVTTGQRVHITGNLDSTTNTITAEGVDIMTAPRRKK
jgi:hypothetical protein